jgi:GT2 family glycosyltransferase
MIYNTFIFNPVRPDYIYRALETLYKYTDMTNNRVIVIDQTKNGLKLDSKVHMVIRPHRNLGFAKSMNEGIIHALHWGSQYITCANDDIEYMNSKWWNGILETFENFKDRALAVNPECPRIPLWGYGRPHGEYVDLVGYKNEFTNSDYEFLLNGDFAKIKEEQKLPATFPEKKSGVTDAIATWHTTFKAEFFDLVGLFEERYYPGGGEDYDLNARAYRDNYRMLGTTKSWVWHWWGSSKDQQSTKEFKDTGMPIIPELRWMNPSMLYPPELNGGNNMDPWGHWTDENGKKIPLTRDTTIGVIDI